ncbi:MAG: hypothetical protein V7K61_12215 [Nostoc sp.]
MNKHFRQLLSFSYSSATQLSVKSFIFSDRKQRSRYSNATHICSGDS